MANAYTIATPTIFSRRSPPYVVSEAFLVQRRRDGINPADGAAL
jgi:hypothetical protein